MASSIGNIKINEKVCQGISGLVLRLTLLGQELSRGRAIIQIRTSFSIAPKVGNFL